jgi:hypothetical protein
VDLVGSCKHHQDSTQNPTQVQIHLGKKKKITMAYQESMSTCETVMEGGLRCWVCAKNQFAQMWTLKRHQSQDHQKRLLQSSLSLLKTTLLTLEQSGPLLNYSTEAESIKYNNASLF